MAALSRVLVVGVLSSDDWRAGRNQGHGIDTWAWRRHKVGLELGDVSVKRAIESERGSQGGEHLLDNKARVGVG